MLGADEGFVVPQTTVHAKTGKWRAQKSADVVHAEQRIQLDLGSETRSG